MQFNSRLLLALLFVGSISVVAKCLDESDGKDENGSELEHNEGEISDMDQPDLDPPDATPAKQSRDLYDIVPASRDRPIVRQDIYNFYIGQENHRRTRPRPSYQSDYNDYYRPNQPPYSPYYNYYQQQQQQQPWPLPLPPSSPSPIPSSTTPDVDPTKPIGYMLINNYRSPFGSFSRPVAFFKSS